jgi:hypothetical protein
MTTYPKTLAAAQKAKGAEWPLADALLEEIGPPGRRDDARFRACQEYLAENGVEYVIGYLRDLRAAAVAFSGSTSRKGITPSNAVKAGTPEVVEAARQMTGKTTPSQREIKKARKVVNKKARKSGAKTRPEKKEATKAAAQTSATELRRAADVMKLTAEASDAAARGRSFSASLADKLLEPDERHDLIAEVETVIETWQAVLEQLQNPIGDEAEQFLKSL